MIINLLSEDSVSLIIAIYNVYYYFMFVFICQLETLANTVHRVVSRSQTISAYILVGGDGLATRDYA